jgi:16S rRNA (guanine1516-N2)-methyltransferase
MGIASWRGALVCTAWILSGYDEHARGTTTSSLSSSSRDNDDTPSLLPLIETPATPRVCVLHREHDDTSVLAALAAQLDLAFMSPTELQALPTLPLYALVTEPYVSGSVHDYALALQPLEELASSSSRRRRGQRASRRATPSVKPLFIDFAPPSDSRLSQRTQGKSGADGLLQAVSPRQASVMDLTAGLGQDALLIATRGGASRVTLVERDPVVAALLRDALRRVALLAFTSDDTQLRTATTALRGRLALQQGDGCAVAEALVAAAPDDDNDPFPDICYLDPMFPARTKTARVKKNMQVLHGLLASQEVPEEERLLAEERLLRAALALAQRKVVVKRPVQAAPLGRDSSNPLPEPSYEIRGAVNRWDVYVQ